MEWVRNRAARREFERFAAETSDLLRVAGRWNRVRSMDLWALYARRVLINLVLYDAGRRARQRSEL